MINNNNNNTHHICQSEKSKKKILKCRYLIFIDNGRFAIRTQDLKIIANQWAAKLNVIYQIFGKTFP